MKIQLPQGRVSIALHQLRTASGSNRGAPALLLLHELKGSSADWRDESIEWDGDVFALDFTGHGESEWLRSSVYYPELFLGDTDVAHGHLESSGIRETCVLGRGVGGYVAMLFAGARPDRVRAAAVLPGRGFDGAGPEPREFGPMGPRAERGDASRDTFDPRVALCNEHVRPREYAADFAERAPSLFLAAPDGEAPAWWSSAANVATARCEASVASAVRALAEAKALAA